MGNPPSSKDLKDLTDLLKLAPESSEPSEGDSASEFALTESPPEQIQEFEGLDELPAFDPAPVEDGSMTSEPASFETANESDFELSPAEPSPLPPAPPTGEVIEKIKNFSEQVLPGKAAATAAFPFSVLVSGTLEENEKARLLDLISRENMGLREVDLEPQLAAGRVLIPRVSEFAAVLIAQALRSARAEIRVGPSDEVFATDDTREQPRSDDSSVQSAVRSHGDHASPQSGAHPAEALRVTSASELPSSGTAGKIVHQVLDVVTASAAIDPTVVEQSSPEYDAILEGLQRELKYKAYRKGANAILNLSIALVPLSAPMRYRLTVSGSAVRATFPFS